MEKGQKQREIRMESRETIRLLQSRKSMRVFEEREIPETVKQEILSESIRAASAGNMALYTSIDVTEARLNRKLSVTSDHKTFLASAELLPLDCADERIWYRGFD